MDARKNADHMIGGCDSGTMMMLGMHWTISALRMAMRVLRAINAYAEKYLSDDDFYLESAIFDDDVVGCSIDVEDRVRVLGGNVRIEDVVPKDILDVAQNPRIVIRHVFRGVTRAYVVTPDSEERRPGEKDPEPSFEVVPACFSDPVARFFVSRDGKVCEVTHVVDEFRGPKRSFGADDYASGKVELRVGWMTRGSDLWALTTADGSIVGTKILASDTVSARASK